MGKKEKENDGVAKKTREERQQELEQRKQELKRSRAELNARMKELLSDELAALTKREKTRGAEILGVFAEHNFYANGFTPEELRTTLEDLGPTYVKIGQIMSSRVDLLPQSYCDELQKLRSNVKPLDAEVARAVIEQETGKRIDEIFSEFRDKPLGSASIGQAHYAVMKDGTRVVTKVQRPLIADMMRKDFVLLKKMAGLVNMAGEESEGSDTVDLVSVIEELEKVTDEELDFRIEAENTKFFKENCIEDEEKISCPDVIDELTTERIFTMTFVDGYSISKKEKLQADGVDPVELGHVLIDNYVHQILDVGVFHADPHQGNIMVSSGKPYWIDFGMVGRITDADITLLQNLILSLLSGDLDGMVNAIMSMGAASPQTDRNKLLEDLDIFLDRYINVTSVDELDMSVLLDEVMNLASTHHISLPGKYTMLVRSIGTIEGVIEELCPELNLFEVVSSRLADRMKQNLDIENELASIGKDVLEASKKTAKIPVLASDALNSFVRGRSKLNLELTGYEDLVEQARVTIRDLVLALFACILFFGSSLLATADIQPKTPNGLPLIAAVGLVFSVSLGIYVVRKMSKKK